MDIEIHNNEDKCYLHVYNSPKDPVSYIGGRSFEERDKLLAAIKNIESFCAYLREIIDSYEPDYYFNGDGFVDSEDNVYATKEVLSRLSPEAFKRVLERLQKGVKGLQNDIR